MSKAAIGNSRFAYLPKPGRSIMLKAMAETIYRRCDGIMDADVGQEMVALDLSSSACFGFNEAAAAVWRSLATPKTFDALRSQLMSEFDVGQEQCTAELRELLQNLRESGLVEQSSNA